MPPILLIDTYSVFFRAFHALPPMTTSGGEPTSALYGTSVLLLKLLREHEPAGIAFAVDAPGGTFRHETFAEYKGNRPELPDALDAQFDRLEELLDALGVPVWKAPGFEADDVLATLSAELAPAHDVLVVSGDRDLFQVVDEHVEVLFMGQRGREPTRYDLAAVRKRFGLSPRELPSFVALVGDPSDNIPRVPGVGPRTASSLVSRFGSIGGILASLDAVERPRIREALRAAGDRLRANEALVRLRRDVPLPAGARHGAVTVEAIDRVRALFEALEFKSLLSRLESLRAAAGTP